MCRRRSNPQRDLADGALVFHFHRPAAGPPPAREYQPGLSLPSTMSTKGQSSRRLIAEQRFHRGADEHFDGQTFQFVFVRRLLPCKMFRIPFANALDQFNGRGERLKTVAVDHMQLRAVAKLSGKFVKSWLEIIFTEKRAR